MVKRIGLIVLAASAVTLLVPTSAAAQGAGSGDNARSVFAGVTFVEPSNIRIVLHGGIELPRGTSFRGSMMSIPVGGFFVDGPANT